MKKFEMCQRPERAYFISTEEKNMSTLYTMGVNALNGLTSFLPKSLDALTPAIARCQRPERALLHFYADERRMGRLQERKRCQRPERAYFISTVPSKTP